MRTRRAIGIYAEFAQHLIRIARRLYIDEPFGVDLKDTVYALDSTTIDLCLAVFPWAPFRSTTAAIKLHTLIDLRGNIPGFIHISDGKLHDVNALDELLPEPGAFLCDGSGLRRFPTLAPISSGPGFLRHAREVQSQGEAPLLHCGWIALPV
jgi:hypothetical protein